MKNRNSYSTENKKAFLKALAAGKAGSKDVLQPVSGILFLHRGKVTAHQTGTETIVFKEGEEPDVNTYQEEHRGQYPHDLHFKNLSGKSTENNNKKQ